MTSQILRLAVLATFFCVPIMAQNLPSHCPSISIEGPKQPLSPKDPGIFIAHLSGASTPAKLSFTWAATRGVVSGEFRSPVMHLTITRKDLGTNVTVFVHVQGLPTQCPDTAWEIAPTELLIEGDPLDVFGLLKGNDVKARIDIFYIALSDNAPYTGLIDVYFNTEEGNARRLARVNLILNAIRFRQHDIRKVSFAFMESRGPPETKLWLVPPGADVFEDRIGATFVKGEDLLKNPKKALPKRQCPCK